ncbi:MAG: hypothetical protein NUV72_02035 [Bauldia sp.]|nr:hypothetical protein [Bauldia sp.]
MNQKLRELISRAEKWPEDAQEELARLGLEIEAERTGAAYRATPEELAAIDQAERSGVASEAEVAAAFAKFRRR